MLFLRKMLEDLTNRVIRSKHYQIVSLLLLAIGSIGCASVSLSLAYDVSTFTSVPPPEFSSKLESSPRKIFVSGKFAADERFVQHLNRFRNVVEEAAVFETDDIHIYSRFPEYILNDTRWTKHLDFLHNPSSATARGGGYWFWKSVLIRHHLAELRDGDFLVYTDADVRNPLSFVEDLFEVMQYRDADLSLYLMQHLERIWAKADAYEKLCPGLAPRRDWSISYSGNYMVLRKTSATVRFIEEWEYNVEDLHMINDDPSVLPNLPEYQEHRHDQTVLNLLLKCHWFEPYKAIVFFPMNHTINHTDDQVDLRLGKIMTFSLWKSLTLHPSESMQNYEIIL